MDKEVTNAMIGGAGAAIVQAAVQRYADRWVAPWLYSSTQYAVDLKKAGYIPVSATASDADIGNAIVAATGYEFAAGSPTNLVGTNKRTATIDTYMAAVGQKVAPYLLPSVWGSGLIGAVAALDSNYDFLGLSEYKVMEGAIGGTLLGAAAMRAIPGITGIKAYPSGFDTTATSTMQYLDQNAAQNLNRLAAENQGLRNEIAQLRAAQYPRGMPPAIPSYTINGTQPVVQVTEILPQKGAEHIKSQTGLMGGAMRRATPEYIKRQTGLVTLTGGR